MPETDAATYHLNPFDLTKVWPHEDYPLIEVGVMELNRNADNYLRATSNRPRSRRPTWCRASASRRTRCCRSRLFSYGDAQRYRLGVNHHQIPVNAPRCPFHSYHRDGAMRVDGNAGGTIGYEPNSAGEWQEQPDFREPPLAIEGAADHWNHRDRRRLLLAAGRAVPPDVAGPAASAVRQHGALRWAAPPKQSRQQHIFNC